MQKHFIQKLLLIGFSIGTLFTSAIQSHAKPLQTQMTIHYPSHISQIDFKQNHPQLVNNRLLIPLRILSENLGNKVRYNAVLKEISITNDMNTQILLTIGSSKAFLNAKQLLLDAVPTLYDNTTYVPLRFVTEALGYDVKWDSPNNTVTLYQTFVESQNFKYDFTKQTLFKKNSSSQDFIIADRIDIPNLHAIALKEEETDNGHYLVSILNTYGQSLIHTDLFTYYISNNRLIDSSSVHYWNIDALSVTHSHNTVVISDGKTARIYNDKTLELEKNINLSVLMGEYNPNEINYIIEGVGDSFLLVRGPSGILTLIYTNRGEKIQLRRELLEPIRQTTI
ncbi:MAG: copper amine oxidase family protein [Clostridia bacterium]|jgi:hypothetical protein|nr:copper amine oxidase family protein [Clostridia bacterium]